MIVRRPVLRTKRQYKNKTLHKKAILDKNICSFITIFAGEITFICLSEKRKFMNKMNWKALLPHFIAVVIFVVVAFMFCKPASEGKVLQQHDVTQWKGMAQNCYDYKDKHGHFPLWTNGMFSGMPSYQIVMDGDNPVNISIFMQIISLHLPKPMNFFFIACICFYFLSQVMRINPYIGIMGALGYAYATYNPIIIVAGHDTKMMAIAYLPFLIGSILLIFRKQYWWGLALTAISASFLIQANHMQITYYGFMIVSAMSLSYLIIWIKEKDFKHIALTFGLLIIGGGAAVGYNAVNLMTTYEYAKETIRGGSVLSDKNSKTTATGLSKDYAFSYSMYKAEPLVLMFPYAFGGSNSGIEVSEDESKAIKATQDMPQQLGHDLRDFIQFYWGGIGGTSGPPYIGAIICFLALLGFVVVDNKYRWWMLGISVLAIVMSWGQFFEGFNLFLLNHLPMYNKFRAPSMIMVIPTFVFSMMAMASFDTILKYEDKEELWKKLKKGFLIAGAIFAIALLVFVSSDFKGEPEKVLNNKIAQIQDIQQRESLLQTVHPFIKGLMDDRKDLFLSSIFRSFLFIIVPVLAIYLFVKKKINSLIVIVAVALFAFIDVMSIDVKYMKDENFQDDNDTETTFKKTDADQMILNDTGYYRVFNLTQGAQAAFNQGALNSYYHKSVGGYHPAKLSIYQDLIEHQLYNFPNCMPVVNMLNTKYIVTPGQAQNAPPMVQINPNALGACWFVKGIVVKKTPNEIMDCLTTLDTKDSAVISEDDKALATASAQADSTAKISLVKNDNDFIEYSSNSSAAQFAVFSEVYYKEGWKAYIDDKETPIVKTNYVLRGLSVPAGNHKITFEFKPSAYYGSMKTSVAASGLMWLMLFAAIGQFFYYKRKNA